MIFKGRVSNDGDGMMIATRGMLATVKQIETHTTNIAHFGLPGYQRKEAVVTSFVEHLGANAVDEVVSTEIGRIRKSNNPLDFALRHPGYFQHMNTSGSIELTRDGRMKLDKDGNLLSLAGHKILSDGGSPIQFTFIPKNPDRDITVSADGEIKVFHVKTQQMVNMGRIGVVSQTGTIADKVDIRQGHVEDSNVYLQQEFTRVVPLRRQFEANRQIFITQSDVLSRTIQELGRPQ